MRIDRIVTVGLESIHGENWGLALRETITETSKASLGWQVFMESNDAIFMTSEDNLVREVNPFAQRLTGYARSDLLKTSLFELVSSSGDQTVQDVINALKQTGIFHSRERFQLKRRKREGLPINLSISRIHLENEIRCVVIARDVSDRAEAERQLRQAHDNLEQRVADRTAELQAAHDRLMDEIARRRRAQSELEDANRKLTAAIKQQQAHEQHAVRQEQFRTAGQLASGMAHDINNSVAPILNLVELLASDNGLSDSQRQSVDQIKMCATDIAATVKRLRDIRPLPGQLQRSMVAVPKLLKDVVGLTRHRWHEDARRRGASIDVRVTVLEPTTLDADESAIRSVLTNLVFNAVDAIDDAGEIELVCGQSEGKPMIRVSDNGIGMSESQRAHCFDPFASWRKNGCGLGLSLCQRIIKQHGGQIDVFSTPGVGTSFRLLFASNMQQTSHSKQQFNLPPSTRFLVVDDDEVVRSSTQSLFMSKGMKIDVAVDAEDALQRLQQSDYDVVISDFGLPGIDGRQLLQQCRQQWPHLLTVLVSGWIDHASGASNQESAHITLDKPFQLDALFKRLADLSDHIQSHDSR